jgi:hypothetical protein
MTERVTSTGEGHLERVVSRQGALPNHDEEPQLVWHSLLEEMSITYPKC